MTEPAACPNCAHRFSGPASRFCPNCGQETRVRPPTLMEFVQQFGGAYLSTEGALWRTLALLLARPGELTRRYLAGQRKRYVLPLRLYLTISLLVLLAMRTVTSVNFQLERPGAAGGPIHDLNITLFGGSAGVRDGRYFCTDMPAWVCKRLQRRLDHDAAAFRREAAAYGERFVGNLGGAMFLLLPGFALWLRLAYWNRRLRYTEHLVFALHLHAFWFVMLGLGLGRQDWLVDAAALAAPLYALLAMRRVYGGRWWTLLLRAAAIALAYLVTLGLVLAGLAVWSLLF